MIASALVDDLAQVVVYRRRQCYEERNIPLICRRQRPRCARQLLVSALLAFLLGPQAVALRSSACPRLRLRDRSPTCRTHARASAHVNDRCPCLTHAHANDHAVADATAYANAHANAYANGRRPCRMPANTYAHANATPRPPDPGWSVGVIGSCLHVETSKKIKT